MERTFVSGVPGAMPGMSGGPVIEKLVNGKGKLLGICSGSKGAEIKWMKTMNEAAAALSSAQTDIPHVYILPALSFSYSEFD